MSHIRNTLYNTITHHCCALCGKPILLEFRSICDNCFIDLPILKTEQGCNRCGLPLLGESGNCMRCRNTNSLTERKNHPLFAYRGTGKNLLEEYKFELNRSLAHIFAEILYIHRLSKKVGYTVVPVPASQKGIKKRGWDQVEEIGKILWDRYGIPYNRAIHRKTEDLTEQKNLNRVGRKIHSKNIFFLSTQWVNNRVILLDDIATTGATIDACYEILKNHGVSHIYLCTIAQV